MIRVLSWNLFHGRALPPVRRGLVEEFSELISGWSWDVALLQEVPPWWTPALARAANADWRTALTSRNVGLALRRALAERNPELLKSNGGGSNAILARRRILRYEALRLRTLPERRVGQLASVSGGIALANLHSSTRVELAEDELRRMWGTALAFARGEPLVLGGDLNLRHPEAAFPPGAPFPSAAASPPAAAFPPGVHAAARDVDHVFASGLEPLDGARVLERRASVEGRDVELSDHPPLLVSLGPPQPA